MRRIFFPLRSSAGWFESRETVSVLEGQLKLSLICFDELVFEKGEYNLVVTEEGSYSYIFPHEAIPEELRTLKFGRDKILRCN